MTKILENNLKYLRNKELKAKLENHTLSSDVELVSENGYNLKYKGKFLHNEKDPLAESQQIFSQTRNTKDSIHVIYGIGLGYLFQIAAQNSKGLVFLYESNLDILCTALTLVDFSNELLKNNIFIFDTFESLTEQFISLSKTDSDVNFLSLPNYREINEDKFRRESKELELIFGSILVDDNYKKKKLFDATLNVFQNVPMLINETPMNVYEDKFNGQAAVIVSAGPTLAENVEILKKNRDKFYIFVVGPALKVLLDNDIKPDFLCIIESMDCSKQVSGLDLSDITMIVEPYTYQSIHKLNSKHKILHISSNMASNDIWAEVTKFDNTNYASRGTVSFAALNSAVNMGFNNVILVGQDLAYIDNNCYAKGSVYEDLVCELNPNTKMYEIKAKDFDKFANVLSPSPEKKDKIRCAKERLENLNSTIHTVIGIDGSLIATSAAYAAFIYHFSDYARSLKNIKLINTSMKGAQIDGFENIPLEKSISELKNRKIINLDSDYKYDIENVRLVLEEVLNGLKKSLEDSEDCNKIMSRLNMEFKRKRVVDKDVLLKIRKMIDTYVHLTDISTLSQRVYSLLTMAEDLDLQQILKKISEYNLETVPKAIDQLKKYYTGVIEKLKIAIPEIETSIKYLEEGSQK